MKVFSKEKYLKSQKERGLSKLAEASTWWRKLDGVECKATGTNIAGQDIYMCRGKLIIDEWTEEAEK